MYFGNVAISFFVSFWRLNLMSRGENLIMDYGFLAQLVAERCPITKISISKVNLREGWDNLTKLNAHFQIANHQDAYLWHTFESLPSEANYCCCQQIA